MSGMATEFLGETDMVWKAYKNRNISVSGIGISKGRNCLLELPTQAGQEEIMARYAFEEYGRNSLSDWGRRTQKRTLAQRAKIVGLSREMLSK